LASAGTLAASDLKIVDATGRVVLKLAKGNVTKEVSLQDIKAGVYFLTLKTPSQQYSERIIVH